MGNARTFVSKEYLLRNGGAKRYRELFEIAPVSACITSLDGRIIEANEAMRRLVGRESTDYHGFNAQCVYRNIADREKLFKRLRGGETIRGAIVDLLRADGAPWIGSMTMTLFQWGDERLCLACIEDITELRRAEEELKRYRAYLEEMVRKRTEKLEEIIQGLKKEIAARERAEKALRDAAAELRERHAMLERKNIAFRELLSQIGTEKKQIGDDVLVNVKEILFPIVRRLEKRGKPSDRKYFNLLYKGLEQIASPFGRILTRGELKLSPREIEICAMVRGGLSNKDISGMLYLSIATVERHREHIRKKLGISNKKINLTAYLRHS